MSGVIFSEKVKISIKPSANILRISTAIILNGAVILNDALTHCSLERPLKG